LSGGANGRDSPTGSGIGPTPERVELSQLTVYLILQFSAAFLYGLVFTVNMLYQVTVVELTPLQLVLMGTILEVSIFVFEIPTGVLADIKSRRLSVILGYFLIGGAFVLEGSLPYLGAVALAQALWGLGYTFTSGATQAWIADELGEERAGEAFMRGAQASRIGSLVAIPFSVGLGLIAVQIPIVAGGVLFVGLALFLILTMREKGFTPTRPEDRSTWGLMLKTVGDARNMARRQPILYLVLAVGFFFGLYSEGFDRLWTAHLLQDFALPLVNALDPVVWFGIIRAGSILLSLGATELARRRVDTSQPLPVARGLQLMAGLIVVALAAFGLTHSFWVAILLYWAIGAFRSVAFPLYDAWNNLLIDDPQVRATMFSAASQADAVGQFVGGPAVGAIGNASLRAALVTSALLLSPVIPLLGVAARKMKKGAPAPT
jgi:DHA3 family tetracycline resistance protein-like MFS transporter